MKSEGTNIHKGEKFQTIARGMKEREEEVESVSRSSFVGLYVSVRLSLCVKYIVQVA